MQNLKRGEFLKKLGLFGAGAITGATILSACGEGAPKQAPGMKSPESMVKKDNEPSQPMVDCSEYNNDLSQADMELRNNVAFVNKSETKDQNCKNCRFWQPDKFEGDCGGCQLFVNGAVNPGGWCKSWQTPPAS
ncbi:MAG: high-potential iron-sulfur protein [Vicingaceae bacterium]